MPAFIGAVKWAVAPLATSPVLKEPETAVTVCVTLSAFLTVTDAPGCTVNFAGAKEKFLMVMVVPEVAATCEPVELDGELLPPDEQAAKVTAATAKTGSSVQARRWRERVARKCPEWAR